MTKYERAIYNIVRMSHEHLTVRQIFERLKMDHPKVVLATVYNNLNKMWESGLIRKVSVEGMRTGTIFSRSTITWFVSAVERYWMFPFRT